MDSNSGGNSEFGTSKDPRKMKAPKPEEVQQVLFASQRLMGIIGAAVCHELNNPLQGVVGFLDLLLQTETDAQRKADLDYVLDCGLQCRHLADGLGRLVETYPPVSVSFDVKGYWEEVLMLCKQDWKGKELVFHEDLQIEGTPENMDPYYFLTMLLGTVGEACVIAPTQGVVRVSMVVGGKDRLRLRVSVEKPEGGGEGGAGGAGSATVTSYGNEGNSEGCKPVSSFVRGLGLWFARRAARLLGGRLEGDFSPKREGVKTVLVLVPPAEF